MTEHNRTCAQKGNILSPLGLDTWHPARADRPGRCPVASANAAGLIPRQRWTIGASRPTRVCGDAEQLPECGSANPPGAVKGEAQRRFPGVGRCAATGAPRAPELLARAPELLVLARGASVGGAECALGNQAQDSGHVCRRNANALECVPQQRPGARGRSAHTRRPGAHIPVDDWRRSALRNARCVRRQARRVRSNVLGWETAPTYGLSSEKRRFVRQIPQRTLRRVDLAGAFLPISQPSLQFRAHGGARRDDNR